MLADVDTATKILGGRIAITKACQVLRKMAEEAESPDAKIALVNAHQAINKIVLFEGDEK